jgi:hypothetical protein
MKSSQKLAFVFMGLLLFCTIAVRPVFAEDSAGGPSAEIKKPDRCLVVTYFHTTFRCPTCHRIEELSAHSVKSNFENELTSGKVVWRVINVEDPGNEHFVQDYGLYSKHLIVSEVKDGREVRWKDLKDVWTLVKNDEQFEKYVETEISDWLKE